MLTDVPITRLPYQRFAEVLDDAGYQQTVDVARIAQILLNDRTVWCVNSTARGGGVAEMLHSLLAYTSGAGVNSRWVTISGNPEFFTITKRLHHRLHSAEGDGGPLGPDEREIFEGTLQPQIEEFLGMVKPNDIVLVHDPQPAPLVGPLVEHGVRVVWRLHIGTDHPNGLAHEAWDFLRPYIEPAHAYVFSRQRYIWDGLDRARCVVIPPSIDVFSPKNQPLADETAASILCHAGLSDGPAPVIPFFSRHDGSPGRVERRADVLEEATLPASARTIVQVSRWDPLKDPIGVLRGFVERPCDTDEHLVLAGPETAAVTDDPEGARILETVKQAWHELRPDWRERVHIASLPMTDPDENAAIVNALQRRATIVVQKSLAEGFGLTVAEAMWKARPVVASAVGGIQDQVVDGETGMLVPPTDLDRFAEALCALLRDPVEARGMGEAGRQRVLEHFLGHTHLNRWVELLARLIGEQAGGQLPAVPPTPPLPGAA